MTSGRVSRSTRERSNDSAGTPEQPEHPRSKDQELVRAGGVGGGLTEYRTIVRTTQYYTASTHTHSQKVSSSFGRDGWRPGNKTAGGISHPCPVRGPGICKIRFPLSRGGFNPEERTKESRRCAAPLQLTILFLDRTPQCRASPKPHRSRRPPFDEIRKPHWTTFFPLGVCADGRIKEK